MCTACTVVSISPCADNEHYQAIISGLNHLPDVERRFYCPQVFLRLDFQCQMDVSELK